MYTTRGDLLNRRYKNKENKVERNLVSKINQRKIREQREKEKTKMITKILDLKSTKKIRKSLNIGTNLTTYLINKNNQKI